MLRSKKFTIAFFIYMAFITWASLATFPEEDTITVTIPHFDKLVHFCFYLGAAILGVFYVRESTRGRFPLKKALIFSVMGAIVFGIIIEMLQYTFFLNRDGDYLDALANSCGAIAGGGIAKWLFSSRNRLKWK